MNKLVTAAVVGGAALAVGVLPAASLASAATAPTPIPVPTNPTAPTTPGMPTGSVTHNPHAPGHRKPSHHKTTRGHHTSHKGGTGHGNGKGHTGGTGGTGGTGRTPGTGGAGGTGKPVAHKHPAHHPNTHKPAHKPVVHKPVTHKPVRKPVVIKPVRKPVITTPVVHPPVVHPPVSTQPVVAPPVVHQPVGKKPIGKKPIAHKPVKRKPIVRRPVPTTMLTPQSANELLATPRIVGGKNAGDSPWAVQVSWDDTGFECSGTAVAPQWVLTAGHCANSGGMTVLIGSNQLGQGTKAVVDNKVVDPDGDLALLHLTDPVQTTFVALADQDPDVGSINEIYGWGKTDPNSGPSDQLKTAKVKVTSTDCEDGVGGKAICSTGITGTAFNGDSGGPEMADGVEVGVCSTGDADTKMQEYASVAASRDWIRQVANV